MVFCPHFCFCVEYAYFLINTTAQRTKAINKPKLQSNCIISFPQKDNKGIDVCDDDNGRKESIMIQSYLYHSQTVSSINLEGK